MARCTIQARRMNQRGGRRGARTAVPGDGSTAGPVIRFSPSSGRAVWRTLTVRPQPPIAANTRAKCWVVVLARSFKADGLVLARLFLRREHLESMAVGIVEVNAVRVTSAA